MEMAMEKRREQGKQEQNSRKRKIDDLFTFLPDVILISILLLFPTEVLRFRLKLVCKRWFRLITNQILLDQASLIIQKPVGRLEYVYRIVDFNDSEQGLKIKEQALEIPCNGLIRSWCNELVLILAPGTRALFIFNLITKVGLILPSCSPFCIRHFECQCGMGLAFDESKRVFKVVHVFIGLKSIHCEILFLKCESLSFSVISNWKTINSGGPSYKQSIVGERLYFWDDPVSIRGRYFHWDVHSNKHLVSMDTVKERFRQTRLPETGFAPMSDKGYYLIEMNRFLSLVLPVSESQMEIWVLKDFQRTVWEKVKCISYVPLPHSILPVPVTNLRNWSNIIIKTGTELVLLGYKFKKTSMDKLEIQIAKDERYVVYSSSYFG